MILSRGLPLAALLLLAAGCAGYDPFGGYPGGGYPGRDRSGAGRSSSLYGEVQRVDHGRQELRVRTRAGRATSVEYDSRTRVSYGGDRYPVSALERGDLVSVQVRQGRGGRAYAERIQVQRSRREGERGDPRARVQRLDGRVGRVDARAGWFELRTQREGSYSVSLPPRADRAIRDRFQRLRSGDRVRVEGAVLGNGRVELYRFR